MHVQHADVADAVAFAVDAYKYFFVAVVVNASSASVASHIAAVAAVASIADPNMDYFEYVVAFV